MPPAPATTSDQALGNLQQFQSQMQSPDQMVQNAQQSVGLGAAQQQVSGLRQAITNTTNLLNNVAPSVMGRTENSLVTSAQANKQISNEQAPISQTLQKQSSDLTNASDDLKNLTAQADQIVQLKEAGQTQQLNALKDIYDSLSAKEKQQFDQQNAQAANALEQQKLAEQQREFNTSQQNKALSPSEQKSLYDLQNQQNTVQGVQSLTASLSKVTGRDGYVSPQDYGKAKQAWAAQGFDPTKFDAYFAKFRNPQNKYYPVDKSSSAVSSLTNAGF